MLKEIKRHNIISLKDLVEKRKAFITLFGVEPHITIEFPSFHSNHSNFKYVVKKITSNNLKYFDSSNEVHTLFGENTEYNKQFIVTWWMKEGE